MTVVVERLAAEGATDSGSAVGAEEVKALKANVGQLQAHLHSISGIAEQLATEELQPGPAETTVAMADRLRYASTVVGPTVWVDVTNSMRPNAGRPTGIARLELEVAVELADQKSVRLVRFDAMSAEFRHVTVGDVIKTLDRRAHATGDPGVAELPPRRRQPTPSRLRATVRRLGKGPRHKELVGALVALRNDLRAVRRSGVSILRATARWLHVPIHHQHKCASADWSPGDVICILGLWEGQRPLETLARIARTHEARIAHVVYDLIPVLKPQFRVMSPEADRAFFRLLLSTTDIAMPISRSTMDDIRQFCQAEGIPVPSCRQIRIASSVATTAPQRPLALEWTGPFVLCVGTIEIRKNHHLLFDVWESYLSDPGRGPTPTLVIAGSIGWLNSETLNRLRHTPGFSNHVVFIDSPTDSELAWLYQHCTITVYPSFYEGWGLPITESLDAGKVCLTSNVSSMPEAAEGLGVLLDPRDWRAWRRTIDAILDDPTYRLTMEAAIAASHTVTTARDVAAQVLSAIDDLIERAQSNPEGMDHGQT